MTGEEFSINWRAGDAWNKYSPEWMLQRIDTEIQDGTLNPEHSKIFDIEDVRQAFKDGFKTGVTFKITGEILREGEE